MILLNDNLRVLVAAAVLAAGVAVDSACRQCERHWSIGWTLALCNSM